MRSLQRHLLVPVFVLLAPTLAISGWENYRVSRLKDVIAASRAAKPDVATYFDERPVKALVKHGAAGRRISMKKQRFIAAWLKARGLSARYIEVFQNELSFRENGAPYWLPTQNEVSWKLRDDLTIHGVEIYIFANFIGSLDGEPVFIVNRFDVPG